MGVTYSFRLVERWRVNSSEMDLIQAVRVGDIGRVKFLIESGADVNYEEDYEHYTPLLWAVECDRIDICCLLIDKGANINQKNEDGFTPLIMAAFQERINILKLLLIRGANVNHIGRNGETALDYAFERGSFFIANILCWRGAKIWSYNNLDSLLLLIFSRVIPGDILREIHTKWIS
jgi:ankyrin repeat protein